jgi:hypothetical protein
VRTYGIRRRSDGGTTAHNNPCVGGIRRRSDGGTTAHNNPCAGGIRWRSDGGTTAHDNPCQMQVVSEDAASQGDTTEQSCSHNI